jgi:hypothetical protein
MGGFTVGDPLTINDGPSLDESQDSQEVVSLRPQHLFALFEKEVHNQARFDLFTHISEAQIKQLHEYSSIQHVLVLGRLLTFVWYCYQRQRLGLETSPLEVLTVGHVFMAVLIEIFWWDKPPYLRLPVQNLDRQALYQAIPGLERELDGLAADRGKKTVGAYKNRRRLHVVSRLQDYPVAAKPRHCGRSEVSCQLSGTHRLRSVHLSLGPSEDTLGVPLEFPNASGDLDLGHMLGMSLRNEPDIRLCGARLARSAHLREFSEIHETIRCLPGKYASKRRERSYLWLGFQRCGPVGGGNLRHIPHITRSGRCNQLSLGIRRDIRCWPR